MAKKEIIVVLLLLLLISNVIGMDIITDNEWYAGESYNVEISTNLENITANMEITDKNDKEILKTNKFIQTEDGIYSSDVTIAGNEEDTIYILKVIINDGINKFTKTQTVNVKKMPFWKRLLKQITNAFGIEIFK